MDSGTAHDRVGEGCRSYETDMDLIREILLKVEELPFGSGFHDITVEGRSADEINYHVMLLDEAKFIEAEDLTTHGGVCWKPKRLTYNGHEFLDAARSHTVWTKATGPEDNGHAHARRLEDGASARYEGPDGRASVIIHDLATQK